MRKINIIFYLLIVATCVTSQAQSLYPISIEGQWGYINNKGTLIISPQFNYADKFSENTAMVRDSNNLIGYIDSKGSLIIPFKFQEASPFSEGLASVKEGDKYGYINTDGVYVITPQFEEADSFSEGLAQIKTESGYGYINKLGEIIIKPEFLRGSKFKQGLASVLLRKDGELKAGFIDRKGSWSIEPIFTVAREFSEDVAGVGIGGYSFLNNDKAQLLLDGISYFLIGLNGDRITKENYDDISICSEGLIAVKKDNKWGYIDRTGKLQIPFQFDNASKFSEGMAVIWRGQRRFYIDKTGKELFEMSPFVLDQFDDGVALIKDLNSDSSWRYGYINKKGNIIWQPTK